MSDVNKAFETQLRNIQTRTGKTLQELSTLVKKSGLTKHGEIRDMLKRDVGMGHGDANTLAHFVRQSDEERASRTVGVPIDRVVDDIYTGPKEELRPIHEKLMGAITQFGPFEIAPKKSYISLRRKKQFAMIGPATNTRVEVGMNMKGVKPTARLVAMPPGGMCQYKVKLTTAKEVDKDLIAWIKHAYDSAG